MGHTHTATPSSYEWAQGWHGGKAWGWRSPGAGGRGSAWDRGWNPFSSGVQTTYLLKSCLGVSLIVDGHKNDMNLGRLL